VKKQNIVVEWHKNERADNVKKTRLYKKASTANSCRGKFTHEPSDNVKIVGVGPDTVPAGLSHYERRELD
jgi:hypothetical protein